MQATRRAGRIPVLSARALPRGGNSNLERLGKIRHDTFLASLLVGPAQGIATLRRLIEARMAKRGKREFVQVLRLLEVFRLEDVLAGVREAIARVVIGFDAVKHLVCAG